MACRKLDRKMTFLVKSASKDGHVMCKIGDKNQLKFGHLNTRQEKSLKKIYVNKFVHSYRLKYNSFPGKMTFVFKLSSEFVFAFIRTVH